MTKPAQTIMYTYEELGALFEYNPNTGTLIRVGRINHQSKEPLGSVIGTKSQNGYLRFGIQNKLYMVHRICWFLFYKVWPTKLIDHINGDKTDNRINNLREVSTRENGQNRVSHRNGRLVGCMYRKDINRWYARILIKGKKHFLGSFHTEYEANQAYLRALELLNKYGEEAWA